MGKLTAQWIQIAVRINQGRTIHQSVKAGRTIEA